MSDIQSVLTRGNSYTDEDSQSVGNPIHTWVQLLQQYRESLAKVAATAGIVIDDEDDMIRILRSRG